MDARPRPKIIMHVDTTEDSTSTSTVLHQDSKIMSKTSKKASRRHNKSSGIKKKKIKKTSKSKKSKKELKCCGEIGCRKQCLIKVTKGVRSSMRRLVKDAIEGGGRHKCGEFLRQYMIGREVKNFSQTSHHRRLAKWCYYVPVPAPETYNASNQPTELVEVCQVAFMEIFGVTERYVRTAREYQSAVIRKEEIKKGKIGKKRRNKKIPVAIVEDPTAKCTEWEQLKDIFNWSSFQINDDTIKTLFKEGFTSILAVACLQEEDLRYLRLTTNISLGQSVLLREVIASLADPSENNSEGPSHSSMDMTESPMVIPIKMHVSAEQAALLQGSPSPPVLQEPPSPPEDQVPEPSGEPVDAPGDEASGGDNGGESGGVVSSSEESSSDDSDDD